MPLITPNLSEVTSFEALPPGVYPATITSTEFQTSKKGNPMLVVSFNVTHDGKSRTRKSYLVITGAGAYGFDSLLRSTGFADYADRLKAGSDEPFDTDVLNGLALNLQMDNEAYQGNMQDVIKGYLPA